MKTSSRQLGYVRDWEKRNPSRAQARKNKWWQTAKGKAWLKAHQKKRSAYRKRWRAKQRKLRRQNSDGEYGDNTALGQARAAIAKATGN